MAFHVISASAGSGKTYSLNLEVLKILLHPDLSANIHLIKWILALTFTNKAANEMKDRLLETLEQLAKGTAPDSLEEDLTKMLNSSPGEIQKTARKRLEEILFHYDNLSYSTIDTFSFKLIKFFAKELNLTPGVNVEMNHEEAVDVIIENYLANLTEKDMLSEELKNLSLQNIESDKNWDVFPQLSKLKDYILPDQYVEFVKSLLKIKQEDIISQKKRLWKFQKQTEKQIDDFTNEIVVFFQSETLLSKTKNTKNLIKQLLDFKKDKKGKKALSEFISKNLNYFLKKGKNWTPEEEKKLISFSRKIRQAMLRYIVTSYFREALSPLSLIKKITDEIEEFKRENELIFISDFNKTIYRVVRNNPVPFIYFRTGEQFAFLFIDEFQDTSTIQWNNLKPLAEEILSKQKFGMENAVRIYGDAKQSIYRFRGGEPEQFIQLASHQTNPFPFAKKITSRLNKNWRSAKEIVEFNNKFFAGIASLFGISSSYYLQIYSDESVYQAARKQHEGYVEIRLNTVEDKEEYLQQIEDLVKRLIEEKSYRPGDICILYHTHSEGGKIAEMLTEKGYKISSEQSLLLENSLKINALINFYHFYITHNTAYLFEALLLTEKIKNKRFPLNFWHEVEHLEFHEIIQKITEKNIPALYNLTGIYHFFSSMTGLLEFNQGEELAYLKTFLSEINRLEKRNIPPTEFISYWNRVLKKVSVENSPAKDSIQLMTVHKAKGLEFPVVIYAYANTGLQPKNDNLIWISPAKHLKELKSIPHLPLKFNRLKNLYESFGIYEREFKTYYEQHLFDLINKIYVAFTRPSEKLYVLANNKVRENQNTATILLQKIQTLNLKQKEENIFSAGKEISAFEKEIESRSNQETGLFLKHTPFDNPVIRFDTKKMELWDESRRKPVETGLKIHEYLSRTVCKEMWPSVKKQIQRENESNTSENIIRIIENLLNDSKTAFLFDCKQKILTERNILTKETQRPDRIIFHSSTEISIIDFKSGKPLPGHKNQLIRYEKILQQAGFAIKDKILIYLSDDSFRLEKI